MTFDTLQWVCAIAGALMVGISKTGISGLSILAVALFAYVFPSGKQASGLVLPLLIFADVIAVFSYRAHAQWRHVWRVFPWTALGVVIGFMALGRISDRTTRWLIGGIILALTVLSYWRRRQGAGDSADDTLHWSAAIFVGVLAGFVTLIANAAGPLMAVLGLITPSSFAFNLYLLPAVMAGTLIGRWLLKRIDQRVFESLVLALSAIAGLLLLL
jgi:uncharacterized membrane protein YfcA